MVYNYANGKLCKMFIKTVIRKGMLCQDNVHKSKAGFQHPGIRFLKLVTQGIIKNELPHLSEGQGYFR